MKTRTILLLATLLLSCKSSFLSRLDEADRDDYEGGKAYARQSAEAGFIFYQSDESTEHFDHILETEMKKYSLILQPYTLSLCANTYYMDLGFEEVMDSVVHAMYGRKFIDSLVRASREKYLDSLALADTLSSDCCGRRVGKFLFEAENHRKFIADLNAALPDTAAFYFVTNIVNAIKPEFSLLINTEGKIESIRFGDFINSTKEEEVHTFLQVFLVGKEIYPVCQYKGKKRNYIVEEFVAFQWK